MIIDEWKHENYRPTAETNKQNITKMQAVKLKPAHQHPRPKQQEQNII
jgi:hypothetical protein